MQSAWRADPDSICRRAISPPSVAVSGMRLEQLSTEPLGCAGHASLSSWCPRLAVGVASRGTLNPCSSSGRHKIDPPRTDRETGVPRLPVPPAADQRESCRRRRSGYPIGAASRSVTMSSACDQAKGRTPRAVEVCQSSCSPSSAVLPASTALRWCSPRSRSRPADGLRVGMTVYASKDGWESAMAAAGGSSAGGAFFGVIAPAIVAYAVRT